MKNNVLRFTIVIIAFTAFTFLMSYTRPAPDEPKQYIVVERTGYDLAGLQKEVNQKLAEGWQLQGGASGSGGTFLQAMVK